jgi:hypothetical protein
MFSEDLDRHYSDIYEEEVRKEKKLISEYKRKLKGLINISGLFKFLEENDHWTPMGIVDIKLTDEKSSGYSTYQHARIVDDPKPYLYKKNPSDEVKGIDHYYVWQTTGYLDDDYSGFLLFPLKDGKYFKVSYSC